MESKLALTVLVLFVEFVLASYLYQYFTNADDIKRRYWGKNRTWLRQNNSEIIIKMIILFIFLILFWIN